MIAGSSIHSIQTVRSTWVLLQNVGRESVRIIQTLNFIVIANKFRALRIFDEDLHMAKNEDEKGACRARAKSF